MKNKFSFLLALVALLMMSGQTWSEVTMTFKYVNTSNELITDAGSSYNSPISVYSQGESVATVNGIRDDSWNFTGTWSMNWISYDPDATPPSIRSQKRSAAPFIDPAGRVLAPLAAE